MSFSSNHLTFNALCGLPASGKTTYAAHLLSLSCHPTAVLIHPDQYRLDLTGDMSDQSQNYHIFTVLVPRAIEDAYRAGLDVIFDATSYCAKARKGPLSKAKSLGYRVIAHMLDVPFDECAKRNEGRGRKVPLDVLIRMRDRWQDPDPATEPYIDEVIRAKGLDNTAQYP